MKRNPKKTRGMGLPYGGPWKLHNTNFNRFKTATNQIHVMSMSLRGPQCCSVERMA